MDCTWSNCHQFIWQTAGGIEDFVLHSRSHRPSMPWKWNQVYDVCPEYGLNLLQSLDLKLWQQNYCGSHHILSEMTSWSATLEDKRIIKNYMAARPESKRQSYYKALEEAENENKTMWIWSFGVDGVDVIERPLVSRCQWSIFLKMSR